MISEIAGVASSLKAAGDIIKASIGLRDAQALQAKIIELNSVILSAQASALGAQSEHFELLQRVGALEKETTRYKAWDAEKVRYQLQQVWPGSFAYVLKPSAQQGEPMHWLCANCYQQAHKSVLQDKGPTKDDDRQNFYACAVCNGGIRVAWNIHPGKEAEDRLMAAVAMKGPSCPLCGLPMGTKSVKPDPHFAFAGLQIHCLECACGHKEERQHDPNKRV